MSSEMMPGCITRRRSSEPPSEREQPPKKAKGKQRKAGCGRVDCGDEGPLSTGVCSACKGLPTMAASGPRWLHFRSDEHAADLALAWDEWRSSWKLEGMHTVVIQGFMPTWKDCCLCMRGTCFFSQASRWRARQAEEANRRTCAVCESTSSGVWKHPGVNLRVFARYFTSLHSRCSRLFDAGGTLEADSLLCSRCFGDGYRMAPKLFKRDKSTIVGYVNYIELDSNPPAEDTLAFAVRDVVLYCLTRLKDGELVYLADAVDAMRSARQRAGLKDMNEDSLRARLLTMFRDLSNSVVGVHHHEFDGNEVGDRDKRVAAHYLMPPVLAPLYAAKLHRALCRAEKEAETRRSTGGCVDGGTQQASTEQIVGGPNVQVQTGGLQTPGAASMLQ